MVAQFEVLLTKQDRLVCSTLLLIGSASISVTDNGCLECPRAEACHVCDIAGSEVTAFVRVLCHCVFVCTLRLGDLSLHPTASPLMSPRMFISVS